ncbi:MAG: MBL fold metallo-hydrolase [Lachnospiraceae bacterium]|nr:MBL fold metallo-hydrolase [Lachnospiraceae bacterium]
MKLTMLGTGNAMVTECYNTCFVISDRDKYFLVDGGGGNGLLHQLKVAKINWMEIKEIFITHKHVDHLLGIIWMMRLICQNMSSGKYDGEVYIYGHEEVIGLIESISKSLLTEKQSRYIGDRVHLITILDGQKKVILGKNVTFFDIQSTKAKQFGFSMEMENGEKIACCGDETYKSCNQKYVRGSKWLLHEAFCLYSQADVFKPYEKHHATVKEACEIATMLEIENLLLYHTEDKQIKNRKKLYLEEAWLYRKGKVFVPDDLDVIEL